MKENNIYYNEKENNIYYNEDEKMAIKAKEDHISYLNKEIERLLQSVNDQNKEIQTLCDKLNKLNVKIPNGLERLRDDIDGILEECMKLQYELTDNQKTNLDNMGADVLKRRNTLDDLVKMQKEKIKDLKKILIQHVLEMIKLNFEKDNVSNKLTKITDMLKTVEKEIVIRKQEKDKLETQIKNKNYPGDALAKAKELLKLELSNEQKESIVNNNNDLAKDRKLFYKIDCDCKIQIDELDLLEKYIQNLVIVFVQSLDDIDKISYEDMKNKLTNDAKLKNTMDSILTGKKNDIMSIAQYQKDFMYDISLYNKDDIAGKNDEIKNIFNEQSKMREQLDKKIDLLKNVVDEINQQLLLDLVLYNKMYALEDNYKNKERIQEFICDNTMKIIDKERKSQQYFMKAEPKLSRIQAYDKDVNDRNNLINQLTIKLSVQNQNHNHGIFNMINNGQNQNDNDIPQMENNIINEK